MAADLHIHVVDKENLIKDVKTSFDKTCWVSGKGNVKTLYNYKNKWIKFDEFCNLTDMEAEKVTKTKDVILKYDEKAIDNTPNIWIGEVSWLKASILNDRKTFISSTVQKVYDIIGEKLPTINDLLIKKILDAFKLKNSTKYTLNKPKKVEKFLREYLGKPIFTISW